MSKRRLNSSSLTSAPQTVQLSSPAAVPSSSGPQNTIQIVTQRLPLASAKQRISPGNRAMPSSDAAAPAATAAATVHTTAVLANPLNGQFYVIGNPTDVLAAGAGGTTRTLAPRIAAVGSAGGDSVPANTVTIESSSVLQPRDERRRATHNEVERRRRDTINTWIMKLGKLIPDLNDPCNVPNKATHSKGGILAKACEYVAELRNTNHRLLEKVNHRDRIVLENERLRAENAVLREALREHGIDLPASLSEADEADDGPSLGP